MSQTLILSNNNATSNPWAAPYGSLDRQEVEIGMTKGLYDLQETWSLEENAMHQNLDSLRHETGRVHVRAYTRSLPRSKEERNAEKEEKAEKAAAKKAAAATKKAAAATKKAAAAEKKAAAATKKAAAAEKKAAKKAAAATKKAEKKAEKKVKLEQTIACAQEELLKLNEN